MTNHDNEFHASPLSKPASSILVTSLHLLAHQPAYRSQTTLYPSHPSNIHHTKPILRLSTCPTFTYWCQQHAMLTKEFNRSMTRWLMIYISLPTKQLCCPQIIPMPHLLATPIMQNLEVHLIPDHDTFDDLPFGHNQPTPTCTSKIALNQNNSGISAHNVTTIHSFYMFFIVCFCL